MLKIKDNVDLKELEKFGFSNDFGEEYSKWEASNGFDIGYEIDIYNRIIRISFSTFDTLIDIDNTLYDLIKADLVEKVDE